MKPEEQRIAIAEACGMDMTPLTICPHCNGNYSFPAGDDYGITIWGECKRCNKGVVAPYYPSSPNYLNDLNAMHKAEKKLSKEQLYLYGNILDTITLPKNSMEMAYVANPEAGMYPELFRATAAQRAEAFLKTLNLWTE